MKRVLRIAYHTTACWGVFCGCTAIFILLAPLLWLGLKAGGLAEPMPAFQRLSYLFCRWFTGFIPQVITPLRFSYIPPIRPIPTRGPTLFVANHGSVVDLLLSLSAVERCGVMGKKSFAYIPFFGPAMYLTGMIFVDRKRKFESADVFALLRRRLRSGQSVLAFPQGSRALPWSRRTVKRGLFKLVLEEGAVLQPIAIVGTGHILKKQQFLVDIPTRLRVAMHILPAIAPAAAAAAASPPSLEQVTALRDEVVASIDAIQRAERDLCWP